MRPFEPPFELSESFRVATHASPQASAWGRFLTALIVCCGLLGASAWAGPAVTVKDIRLWAGPETTRIVLDLSGPASHAVTLLQHPDRVVVDIGSARFAQAHPTMPAGQGLAKQLRSGLQGEDLRLVVDLASAATPRVFDVAPQGDLGHRLVVDLVAPVAKTATASTGFVVTKVTEGVADGATAGTSAQVASATNVSAGSSVTAAATVAGSTPGAKASTSVLSASTGAAAPASAKTPVTAAANAPAATPVPTVVKSTPKAAGAAGRDIIIAIDAGHGGNDPGSIGKTGTREKDVVLAIARKLKERIDREPGMRAVMTRDSDIYLAHRLRIKRARDQQADMFVSVHADSYTDRSVVGSSVYTLSPRGASDEAARWLAERENAADLVGGVSLEDKSDVLASVLLDLSQGASMSASLNAADKVMDELFHMGNVTRRGVKQAGFLVLKSPDIPSMLVETAFISNPTEEARLKNPQHQQRLAEAIHAGIRSYFYENPPPGSYVAQLRQQQRDGLIAAASSDERGSGVAQ